MRVIVQRGAGVHPAADEIQDGLIRSVPAARERGRNWLADRYPRIAIDASIWPRSDFTALTGDTVAIHDMEEPERRGKVAAIAFSFNRASARITLTIYAPDDSSIEEK